MTIWAKCLKHNNSSINTGCYNEPSKVTMDSSFSQDRAQSRHSRSLSRISEGTHEQFSHVRGLCSPSRDWGKCFHAPIKQAKQIREAKWLISHSADPACSCCLAERGPHPPPHLAASEVTWAHLEWRSLQYLIFVPMWNIPHLQSHGPNQACRRPVWDIWALSSLWRAIQKALLGTLHVNLFEGSSWFVLFYFVLFCFNDCHA